VLAQPCVWALLAAVLLVNAIAVTAFSPGRGRTYVTALFETGRSGGRGGVYVTMQKSHDGWVLATDIATREAADSQVPVYVVRYQPSSRYWGIWSPLQRTHTNFVELTDLRTRAFGPPSGLIPRAEWAAIYTVLSAMEPGRFTPDREAIDFHGGDRSSEVLWLGAANDVFVALCLSTLLAGIAFGAIDSFRDRRDSLIPGHLCRVCRYDLRGVRERSCPECNEPHGPRSSVPRPRVRGKHEPEAVE